MPASRRRWPLVVSVVVGLWSLAEVGNLWAVHRIGLEIAAVAVAGCSVLAAGFSIAVLISKGRSRFAGFGLVALWFAIGVAGLGGLVLHMKPPNTAVNDPRPRPIFAPLIFTLFGIAGVAALVQGWEEAPHHDSEAGSTSGAPAAQGGRR